MEINAANVAWRKIFLWEARLSTEEVQEIADNAIPVATKKNIKFGMRIINSTYPFKFPLKAVKFQT